MAEVGAAIQKVTSRSAPEFDGGAFTISHFSPSPEGFNFQTRESIRRKQTPEGDRDARVSGKFKDGVRIVDLSEQYSQGTLAYL